MWIPSRRPAGSGNCPTEKSDWSSRDGLTQDDGVFKWETGGKDAFYVGAGETVDIAFPTESNR